MSDYNNPNYLALVREEFAQRLGEKGLRVSFVKVKKTLTEESTQEERKENFVLDEDSPEDLNNTLWIPLSMTSFPGVLRCMTANQAGYWAIRKCIKENWDFLTDYTCCLGNLEMDM